MIQATLVKISCDVFEFFIKDILKNKIKHSIWQANIHLYHHLIKQFILLRIALSHAGLDSALNVHIKHTRGLAKCLKFRYYTQKYVILKFQK